MTPKKINFNIEKLIKKLNASHTPVFLDVEPESGGKEFDCYPLVQQKVRKEGGRMIMGWQIWESKILVEAECHSVWEDNDGELRDITPKNEKIKKILFVEDENLIYEEKQIANIRINITSNPLVDDLIKVCDAIHKFDNKGERALLYDLTDVLSEEQINHKEYLFFLKDSINFILSKNGNRKSLCLCQSGEIFINCHGKDLEKRIAKDI